GYNVILGKDTVVRRLAGYLPKGVIYDKSLGLARHGKPQRFKRLGHSIAVMDEESTGFYGSPDMFLGVRLSDETLNCAERWYCISAQLRQQAVKEYPNHASKFVVSGLPRTDTWRKELQSLYQDDVAKLKNKYGRYILFCSNFGGIVHARGESFVRKQLRGQTSAYSQTQKEFERLFAEGRVNLEAFINILPQVKNWFPDHKLIIRPHPSESIEFWQDAVGKLENCEVISQGAASAWILGSDCLLHHGCTTGIEAEIMGKAHIMYAPYPDNHHDTEVMKAFAPIVQDAQSLKQAMIDLVENQQVSQRDMQAKEAFFSNLEGKLVSEIILDDIDTFKLEAAPLSPFLGWAKYTPRMLIAGLKPRSKKAKAYANQKWSGISVDAIDAIFKILKEPLQSKSNIQVDEMLKDLFVLTKHKN
ncbi:MAG: surface carbohydrate biosynthesis protein, partial [Salaquimonas sp.]